jgi:hypothetical protein
LAIELLQKRHPLGHGEQRLTGRVGADGHDDPVEELRAALDEIEVAIGDRVEAASIDGQGSLHR